LEIPLLFQHRRRGNSEKNSTGSGGSTATKNTFSPIPLDIPLEHWNIPTSTPLNSIGGQQEHRGSKPSGTSTKITPEHRAQVTESARRSIQVVGSYKSYQVVSPQDEYSGIQVVNIQASLQVFWYLHISQAGAQVTPFNSSSPLSPHSTRHCSIEPI